jgi:hypothetical protein
MAAKNPENDKPEEDTTPERPKQAVKKKPTRSKTTAAKKAASNATPAARSETAAKTKTTKKTKKVGSGAKKPRTLSTKKPAKKTTAKAKGTARPSAEPEPKSAPPPAQDAEGQLTDTGGGPPIEKEISPATETETVPEAPTETEVPLTAEPETAPEAPVEARQPDQAEPAAVAPEIEDQPEKPPEKAEPAVSAPPLPPSDSAIPAPATSEPLPAAVKYFFGGLAILIALIVMTSYQNMQKYYLVAQHGALEVWKGDFSPMGRKLVVIMPGVVSPIEPKEVYSRNDISPIVFKYYMDKADALLDVPGAPDFVDIKDYLKRASEYAFTDEMQTAVSSSVDSIDRTVLLYKADFAAARGTIEDLESAVQYLNQAAALSPDGPEANLIQQKIESIETQIEALESKQALEAAEASAQEKPSVEETAPEAAEVSPKSPSESQAPASKEQSF